MVIKSNSKTNALIFGIFIAGMLSVSISNLFGGYYFAVAVIVAVLSTLLVSSTLDKSSLEDSKIDLLAVGVLAFFEILFFIVNDIFGHSVYVSGNLDIFGYCVIGSQLYSVVMIIYYLVKIVLSLFHKNNVEIIEKVEKKEETVEEKVVEEPIDNEEVEDIKRIPQTDIKKEAPFMEEIK